jgi:SAM-dependent methyltransferase
MAGRRPTADGYDRMHGASASPLLRELWARAFGDAHPAEVEPASSCSWWTLGYAVTALRTAPGGTLVDLGCGRGGPGLWLARALNTALIGIDFSPVAVGMASGRAREFLSNGRADFRVGTFEDTGLADASADGVLSVDALPFTPDKVVAMREIHRILRPGGRLVFSAWETTDPDDIGVADWEPHLTAGGLELEDRREHPGCHDRWLALYALWRENEAELRREVGDDAVNGMLAEASDRPARMAKRRSLLITARRPHWTW